MKNGLIKIRLLGFYFHRKGVSATLSCFMVLLVLFLGQTIFPSFVISKPPSYDIGSNTKTIEYLNSVKSDISSGKKIDLVELDKVYGSYKGVLNYVLYLENYLAPGNDSQIISQIDDLFDKWDKEKTLEVMSNLIELSDENKYKISTDIQRKDSAGQTLWRSLENIKNFKNACEDILQRTKGKLTGYGEVGRSYYIEYTKVCFIEPEYKDSGKVREKMDIIVEPFRKQAQQNGEKEKRQQKVNEAAGRKKDEENKALLAKYNVKAKINASDLQKNPFQFEGKVILLTGASFDRMLERGVAVCNSTSASMDWVGNISDGRPVISTSTRELLVSNVPVDFKGGWGLIVRCKGTTKATNALGAVITLPLVEYIAVVQE